MAPVRETRRTRISIPSLLNTTRNPIIKKASREGTSADRPRLFIRLRRIIQTALEDESTTRSGTGSSLLSTEEQSAEVAQASAPERESESVLTLALMQLTIGENAHSYSSKVETVRLAIEDLDRRSKAGQMDRDEFRREVHQLQRCINELKSAN